MHTLKQKIISKISLEDELFVLRILIIICIFLMVVFTLIFVFFSEYKVSFNYENENCFSNLTLFPKSNSVKGKGYKLSFISNVYIKKTAILSTKSCLSAVDLPKQNSSETLKVSLGKSLFSKKIVIEPQKYPLVSSSIVKNQKVATNKPFSFELSGNDKFFNYKLVSNSKETVCIKKANKIECDIKGLSLKHATFYSFKLVRMFNNANIETPISVRVETITPVTVNETSINQFGTVYDKPKFVTLSFDKNIRALTNVGLSLVSEGKKLSVPVRHKINNNAVTIYFDKELQRDTTFSLSIEDVEAVDGGSLVVPYELLFKTSGGPKVASSNIKNYSLSPNHTFVIDFDQSIEQNQNLAKLISLTSNKSNIPYILSLEPSRILIKPTQPMSKCSPINLSIGAGVISRYGITNSDGWSKISRISCYDMFNIGFSLKGRPILGYKFGTGKNLIVYVGSVHGNEINTRRLLEKWIDELEANPNYPSDKTIVVIPSANPDGNSNNDRLNAAGVDLNRNFPANNWKASITLPSGQLLASGGGPQPLSESESKAIADYVTTNRPGLLITYHSTGAVAIGNGSGNSDGLANVYSSKSGYIYKTNTTIGNYFNYDTTGALEDWMNDKLSTRAILVELRSRYDDEFYRNKSAMWAMAQMF